MNRQLLIIGTAVLALGVVAAVILVPRLNTPTVAVAAGELALADQPVKGEPSAPVEIVVFEDFLCPHCGTFVNNVAPQLKRDFVDTGKARYYMKNFVVMGPESQRVAQVGECVHEQGSDAFWQFETVAFRSQSSLSESVAINLARQYVEGLDAGALDACIAENRGVAQVQADSERALANGLTGTPSVLVNGELIIASNYQVLADAIESAYAEAQD